MFDVIGFGALNLDIIYEVDSLARIAAHGHSELRPGREADGDGESFLRIQKCVESAGRLRARAPGGSAANTIGALSRMGFRTGFIGKLGIDAEGETLLAEMKGVDLTGVVQTGKTGKCLCILDAHRDRFMMLQPNTNDTLTETEIDVGYASNGRYVHLSSFVGEAPFLAQRALVEQLPPSVRITFDPGEVYARRGLESLRPVIQRSHVLFATDREIEKLTGLDFVSGSEHLLGMGPTIIACKRGERGASLFTGKDRIDLPSKPVEVIDNTGAGDVFNAGFLAGALMDRPLVECGRFGIEIASRSLKGFGRSHYPQREDLSYFNNPPE
jgi:sugar/nucleoside kinase (ribokinase family)